MNFLKGDIDHLGKTLTETVEKGADEMRKGLDHAVQAAQEGLRAAVHDASEALGQNINRLSEEVNKHRNLTKDDVTVLIDYACDRLDATVDKRIKEVLAQVSLMVDEKVTAARTGLSAAAAEQKRVFVRNMLVAIAGAVGVGLVSVAARRLSGTDFDTLAVFRIIFGALAAGGTVSFVYRVLARYLRMGKTERDLLRVVVGDARVLNPRGVLLHLLCLLVGLAFWTVLALKPEWLGF
ncbi:MAG: hypothetical protein LBT53_05345 [Puniceicoccales bacterium]|nr:hypothetical protein [Puniceicoccales bacterium]